MGAKSRLTGRPLGGSVVMGKPSPETRRRRPADLRDKKVAVLAPTGVRSDALRATWRMLAERWADPFILGISDDADVLAFDERGRPETFRVNRSATTNDVYDFDALVMLGGRTGAERLRSDAASMQLLRRFFLAGRPIAALGAAVETLAAQGLLRGVRVSTAPDAREWVEEAEATWVDAPVALDWGIATGRGESGRDLTSFLSVTADAIADGDTSRVLVLPDSESIVRPLVEGATPAA